MERTYSSLRIAAPIFLLIHLGIRLIFPEPTLFADLYLYNFVALLSGVALLIAPTFNDSWSKISLSLAFIIWTAGSSISSWNSLTSIQLNPKLTDYSYLLFYPIVLFGLSRALSINKRIMPLEVFDTLIIALGLTSVVAGIFLRPAMIHLNGTSFEVFLSILYPIGDIVLVAITIAYSLLQKKSPRIIFMLCGTSIFALSDLYFLWSSSHATYTFGNISDDGWLIGLVLISEALWHQGGDFEFNEKIVNYTSSFTLALCIGVIGIEISKPKYFPIFVLIPSLATIALAFIRMALAVRDARAVSTERELARTDDLTGLPNRRRFLAELELLTRREGTLLILDLNGFKQVNDKFGHDVGDQLLRQISIRFQRASSDSLIARLGGDEFGVIIYGPKQIGEEVAAALKSTLTYPFRLQSGEVSVGVAIGIATTEGNLRSAEDLLRHADGAMYQAKRENLGLVERGK